MVKDAALHRDGARTQAGDGAVASFAARIVAWQRRAGRHDLPWQGSKDPYRVWLAEVMLQQTQVQTVIPYYHRFLARFANVQALAAAHEDEVLGLWSGLGYYSRARHLHRAARRVVAEHGGQFPRTAAGLAQLPGIGPSTAAAIAAFCFDERISIFDGNVKRLLSRWLGVADDLSRAAPARALYARAMDLLPAAAQARDMPAYTQALMDLGATVCTPRAPRCAACPLAADCVALARGRPEAYPVRRKKTQAKKVSLWLLHAHDDKGRVFLHQRPARGIWARLFCLPAFATRAALLASLPPALAEGVHWHEPIAHMLTHRALQIHVANVRAESDAWRWNQGEGQWLGPAQWRGLGLPAPVRRFLTEQQALRNDPTA